MRLICPNCGAQYEIDAGLIPDAGRDVQCSACGHTWFQHRETADTAAVDEAAVTGPAAARAPAEAVEPPAAGPPHAEPARDERPAETEPADTKEPADAETEAPAEPDPTMPEQPARRPDAAAMAILREEAEREAAARRREAAGLETQGDLGLDGGDPHRSEQRPTAPDAESEPSPAESRRDVFPDIEEVNSSLSVAEAEVIAHRDTENAAETGGRSRLGFRIGFLAVVVSVSVLIVAYAFAPELAEALPSVRPMLSDYVDWANARRDDIDGIMQSAIAMIARN